MVRTGLVDGRLNIDANGRVYLQAGQCKIMCRGSQDDTEQVRLSGRCEGVVLPLPAGPASRLVRGMVGHGAGVSRC